MLNLFKPFASWLRDYIPIGRLSYAQEGEDLILARLFNELGISKGFFVDIGAHHPVRYSNTYYFYKRGWCGINVDALPGTKDLFHRMRPKDITLECGVALQEGELKYFMFNEPALNTFSREEAKRKSQAPYYITNTLNIPIVTLRSIFDHYLPINTRIDVLTIDVEGFDHEVIASNNWDKYRPRIVLVELLNTELFNLETHATAQLLHAYDYRVIAKTFNTYFFIANNTLPKGA